MCVAQQISINEVMASNTNTIADEENEFEDWIELYNYGVEPVSMLGYGLSDNVLQPFKWIFPDIVIAPGQYLIVWASGKNKVTPGMPLHTNFRLSSDGEQVLITRPDSVLVSEVASVPYQHNVSYGRQPDGVGSWLYFYTPTPGAANNTVGLAGLIPIPVMSHASGFYTDSFTLQLSVPSDNATIVYTLDGSEPDIQNLNGKTYAYKNQYPQNPGQASGPFLFHSIQSYIYQQPIPISDRSNSPNKISSISSTWHQVPPYLPTQLVPKATVVRAKAYVNGIGGNTVTSTFFVSANGAFNHTLPVVSLCVDEPDLFDYHKGVYVAGVDFDTWRTANPTMPVDGHRPGNYKRDADTAEKVANFQYFVNGQEVLNQNLGINIHGGISRSNPIKSLRLHPRSSYSGNSTLNYPFFKSQPQYTEYKRLILRNSGTDYNLTYFRDAFNQRISGHLRFETQAYQPAVHYINGEFYGILNVRERHDKHYIKQVFGIEETELDLLTNDVQIEVGTRGHFLAMRNFISQQDITKPENYNYVRTLMDIENFIDYKIANIFIRNVDWPMNNIRYFRKRIPQYDSTAPYGHDGRWRWMMYDTDHSFGANGGPLSYETNSLAAATNNQVSWSKVKLRRLLLNSSFRTDFINRFADLLNTAYLPQRMIAVIDEMRAEIAPEVIKHQKRWPGTLDAWEQNIQVMRNFATHRPAFQRQHILQYFGLSGMYEAQLFVSNPAHGYITINTIDILPTTPGVPENPYPWKGIYFNSVPIKLIAKPKPGFKFSHWSGAVFSQQAEITLVPDSNIRIQANFEPDIAPDELLYFWFMSTQLPNDVPLDSIASTFAKDNIPANLVFKSCLPGYPFTPNHPNWRKSSMERRNAPTPLNYREAGNNGIAFANAEMRGIQIKQAFKNGNRENELHCRFSTLNRQRIKFSLAAQDEGAADSIQIQYWNGSEWSREGVEPHTLPLSSVYRVFNFDFSNVGVANNNPLFNIRLLFKGDSLQIDNGKRVNINNIAVEGAYIQPPQPNAEEVIHFWFAGTDVPNNVPLDSLTATFTAQTAPAKLRYQSCLVGYPFTPTHPNWRKSSLERRNDPTPINYLPAANQNMPYSVSNMRGLQVRQALASNGAQSTFTLEGSTLGFFNVAVSMAVKDDVNAADSIAIEYWDGNTWTDHNIVQPRQAISSTFQLFRASFEQVTIAQNNPAFKVRIRFIGNNLESDNGQRVTFNNIAITGVRQTAPCDSIIPLVCNQTIQICPYETIQGTFLGGSPGVVSWHIEPTLGVSKSSGTGTTTGRIFFTRSGTYTLTFESLNNNTPANCSPSAFSACTQTIIVQGVMPQFQPVADLCAGSVVELPSVSINNISGVWSPEVNNQQTTTYHFTPDSGQCAASAQLTVTIVPLPESALSVTVCNNELPFLWRGLSLDSTGLYAVTAPNATGCDSLFTLNLTVKVEAPALFNPVPPVCQGVNFSPLPDTALGGESGTWFPDFNNAASGTYVFTPAAGTCALPAAIQVEVLPAPLPEVILQSGVLSVTTSFAQYQWYYQDSLLVQQNANTLVPTLNGLYSVVVTDSNGCRGSASILVNTLSNEQILGQADHARIFPNPAKQHIHIQHNYVHLPDLEIMDITGRVLLTQHSVKSGSSIPIHKLVPGVYRCILRSPQMMRTIQFTVMP
jgi:hypothetical protein